MKIESGLKIWATWFCVAVAILSVQSAAIYIWYGPVAKVCGNDVFARLQSPGSEDRAYVFQRDCGGMFGYSAQVALRRGYSPLFDYDKGNVLIARGRWLDPQNILKSVRARWDGETLVVAYDDRLKIELREATAKGGKIRLEPFTVAQK